MQDADVYWHVYRRSQIKARLRGNFIYFLEVPSAPGLLVVRHVVDPAGRYYPSMPRKGVMELVTQGAHGVVYKGVNESAVLTAIRHDPDISSDNQDFASYNHAVVCFAREVFFAEPD